MSPVPLLRDGEVHLWSGLQLQVSLKGQVFLLPAPEGPSCGLGPCVPLLA